MELASQTTNNIMEMTAVMAALEYAKMATFQANGTRIYSDSQYVVKGCNEWRHSWKRKGWNKAGGLKNKELWKEIADAHDDFPCEIMAIRIKMWDRHIEVPCSNGSPPDPRSAS